MSSFRAGSAAIIALALAPAAAAQDRTVPLKNWAAPLYWQPSPEEAERSAKATEPEPRTAAMTSPLVFVAVTPCRVVDTRYFTGVFGAPVMAGGTARDFPVPQSSCGIPVSAKAYSLNVTVLPRGVLGFLTMYPKGAAFPNVSTLNALDGQVTANAAIIPAGTGGTIVVYVTNTTELVIDINGYYAPPDALALGAGTAAAPALTFSTDANSGVYSPSAGAVAVAAAGANRLTINSGGISVNGNVDLSGNITKSGIGLLRSEGSSLGLGLNSLLSIGGGGNTAVGSTALLSLTTGSANTGTGYHALRSATSGSLNTALGSGALERLTSGYGNVAVGFDALGQAIDGGNNTAVGEMAGYYTSGSQNVAVGSMALWSSTGGDGQGSIAVGYGALQAHPGSFHNTAVGWGAGVGLKAGYFNLMLGYFAGGKNTGGNYNVYLAYPGDSSQPTEGNTIRIGNEGSQTRAFITGIRGATTGSANAIPVVIDSNGQLGTASSSRRAKTGIREIGDTTNTVMALRPVRFRYKAHASDSPEQYGLVAEEVAEVAPDLVARNREGQVETVFYDKVNAMLLNEVQKQHRTIGALLERLAELESQVAELSAARK